MVTSFVAVGDSFTEGMQDGPDDTGAYRGWADRVATALAARADGFRYANLAVRGKLLDEVAADQLVGAVALEPDLLSFHAGGNDVLRPGASLDAVARRYDLAVRRALLGAGRVLLFTVLERSGARGAAADRVAARVRRFNDAVRVAADRDRVVLVDVGGEAALHDRRLWHEDRLHLAPAGHERIAAAVLDALGVPQPDGRDPGWWREPLPAAPDVPRGVAVREDLRWVGRHLLPWVGRRLRGTSSGDGLLPKRPRLEAL